MICAKCGLALPAHARFCARCGTRLGPTLASAPAALAPVWLLVLFWVGAGGLLSIAALYTPSALGLALPQGAAAGLDPGQVRAAATLLVACGASLGVAHAAAAVGLMGARTWARPFATMVCVVWALTCVGLPIGLLGITALWRAKQGGTP